MGNSPSQIRKGKTRHGNPGSQNGGVAERFWDDAMYVYPKGFNGFLFFDITPDKVQNKCIST